MDRARPWHGRRRKGPGERQRRRGAAGRADEPAKRRNETGGLSSPSEGSGQFVLVAEAAVFAIARHPPVEEQAERARHDAKLVKARQRARGDTALLQQLPLVRVHRRSWQGGKEA